MVPDIASGLITSTFLSANQALAQVQTGAIRIIGAINDGRSKYFPDAPTMAEQGFAEAQVTPWFGSWCPTATPQPIVERISKALEAALATSDVREKLESPDARPRSAPLAEFADIIKSDVALWAKVGQGGRHHRRLRAEAPTRPAGSIRESRQGWVSVGSARSCPGFGMFPRDRNTSYIAAVWSPAPIP